MTIKHQGKNISAEINVTQLFDINVEKNGNEITAVKLTRKDFYTDEDKPLVDLMDYFYTEQEIDNFVRIQLVVYDSFEQLPQTDDNISFGKSNYIYLVPFQDQSDVKEGIYKEYVWVKIKDSSNYRTNKAHHNDYIVDGDHYNYESLGSTEINLNLKLDKAKVIDNLTTNSFDSSDPTALSARQGKILNDTIIDVVNAIEQHVVVIELSKPNPVANETILLIAKLYSDDIQNKTVEFYNDTTLLGRATTNARGVAVLSHTLGNTGQEELKAKCGSVISDTINITIG